MLSFLSTRTGQKMSKKSAAVQRKTLTDLLKAFRATDQSSFERLQETFSLWKQSIYINVGHFKELHTSTDPVTCFAGMNPSSAD